MTNPRPPPLRVDACVSSYISSSSFSSCLPCLSFFSSRFLPCSSFSLSTYTSLAPPSRTPPVSHVPLSPYPPTYPPLLILLLYPPMLPLFLCSQSQSRLHGRPTSTQLSDGGGSSGQNTKFINAEIIAMIANSLKAFIA